MKKLVVELELFDERTKRKAMRKVSDLEGINSIQIDLKNKKLTVIGNVDPVSVVSKLRKLCWTTLVSVEPAKEENKKPDDMNDAMPELFKAYQAYNYPYKTPHYYVRSAEEDQNACVIC